MPRVSPAFPGYMFPRLYSTSRSSVALPLAIVAESGGWLVAFDSFQIADARPERVRPEICLYYLKTEISLSLAIFSRCSLLVAWKFHVRLLMRVNVSKCSCFIGERDESKNKYEVRPEVWEENSHACTWKVILICKFYIWYIILIYDIYYILKVIFVNFTFDI